MITQTSSLLLETRDILHKWLSLATSAIMIFFCFVNIVMLNQVTIGVIDSVFGLLNLYSFRKALLEKTHEWHHYMLAFSMTVVVLSSFYFADLRAGSIYWLLILPPLYCLLAGPKLGLFYTIILSLPALAILFIKSDTEDFLPYRSILNFVLAYFLSYGICYLYESQYAKSSLLLERMAFQDPLTGAQNRHALKLFFDNFNNVPVDPFLKYETEETRLLIIDIDYFKSVNDEFGHDVGDSVLLEMTELLHYLIHDEHVYRIGGEEFLITLKNHTQNQAYDFAEKIRKEVEKTVFRAHQQSIRITVSIGIAQLQKGQSFREFLRDADKNLYSAKNKGRNLVHYGPMNVSEAV
ncbi:diguanylate cyclase (GGDEF)-like protein [Marinomonas alcarazii]|uniref:diguanylate cyclase n=1 Tax=Marinomonas alcarazii TaxID=491949 RepID=A0A318UZC7_9GAMM|nr:GGDEF domain-containing protein [Marinomonas alcarazii]PYF80960.1 diguanylate cyclase (GGDEF)-like protein [Marinomonas alcarazii]